MSNTSKKINVSSIISKLHGSPAERFNQIIKALFNQGHPIEIKGEKEDSTPFEYDKHSFLQVYDQPAIPELVSEDEWIHVEELKVENTEDSIMVELIYEYHPSVSVTTKFTFTIYD
ncbi:hypothetical protein AAAC51_08130 [Priestia megaterium]